MYLIGIKIIKEFIISLGHLYVNLLNRYYNIFKELKIYGLLKMKQIFILSILISVALSDPLRSRGGSTQVGEIVDVNQQSNMAGYTRKD